MAIIDYLQSGFEKVFRPKAGHSGRVGKGIGNTVGAAEFEDDVRSSFSSFLRIPSSFAKEGLALSADTSGYNTFVHS